VFWAILLFAGCSAPNVLWIELSNNHCELSVCPEEELDKLPEPKSNISPLFPRDKRSSSWVGTTVLRLYVDPNGIVQCVELVESSGNKEADLNSKAAAKKCKFVPGEKAGKRVWTAVEREFTFIGQNADY
jgi:TonB family protein